MANKYYLIPKDLYDGLNKTEPENINIDFERKEVDKTKKVEKKDIKNILYNQELKRYIKLKKESDNKPVRVELTNGAKLIAPPKTARTFNHNRRLSLASVLLNRNGNNDDEGDEISNINPSVSDEIESHQEFETPKTSQSQIKFSRNGPANRLYQHIKDNPIKFNILNENILYRAGTQIIKGSDLKSSIVRLIDPLTENAPSPPGTSQLLSKINKDPLAKRYFTVGRNYWREQRLGINQSGRGIKKSLVKKTFKLSPQLWK